MAHVCTSCGTDLSARRAPPDRMYDLPLVVCPGCGAAWVRRTTLRRWRSAGVGPALASGWALVLRGSALALLALLGAGVIVLDAGGIDALRPGRGHERPIASMNEVQGAALLVLVTLAWLPLTAIGLRWVLGHLARGRRALVWAGCIGLVLWGLPNAVTIPDALFTVGPRYRLNQSSISVPSELRIEWGEWEWAALLVALGLGVWALGRRADRFGAYTGEQAWLARLARARRRRARRRG